jgi:hypothetical protein
MTKKEEYERKCEADHSSSIEQCRKIKEKELRDLILSHHETSDKYKEILKLDRALTGKSVPHSLCRFLDGWQVVIWTNNGESRICDAVEDFASYGGDEDKIEIMGAMTDKEKESESSVLGYLSADEVAKRFEFCSVNQTDIYKEAK